MGYIKEIPQLPEKEKKALDRKLQALEPKLHKAKKEYDALVEEYKELWDQRHPEKQEQYLKETLYKAYIHSHCSLEQVLTYMAMPDVEDRFPDSDEESTFDE